ncbi:MAG TPA: TolC family protein, partial [Terriglobales bacterium]|nr:TolC family protein [Terriglobales bacterium]
MAQSGGTPAVSARVPQSAAAEVTLEAPQPQQNAGAQSGTQQSVPLPKPAPGTPQKRSGTQITLDQAIQLAIDNSPTLKASRTQIEQNQAQEITANLRPNPTLSWDTQFVPIFTPSLFSSETLQNLQQFDVGVGYTFERGQKRQHRLQAARDATAVTEAQVADTVRTLSFNVAQQFVNVLLAQANIDLSQADLDSFQQTVTISQERYRAGDISEGDLLKIKLQ